LVIGDFNKRGYKMRQFAVIGLGQFGSSVANTLVEKGVQVLGVDIDEAVVREMSEVLTNAVQADATDEKVLKAIGIQEVDVAIISVGENIESSVLIALLLKDLGIKQIIAKVISDQHARILERIGVSRVINPEKDMGKRLANSLASPNILEQIDLSGDYAIIEMIPPEEFVAHSLKELDVRAKYGVNIIAIKHGQSDDKESINVCPLAEDVIRKGDILVVIGSSENINKVKKKK
jgi:trk system potassium uptake protein TrkA